MEKFAPENDTLVPVISDDRTLPGLVSDGTSTDGEKSETASTPRNKHEMNARRPATEEELRNLRRVRDHIPIRVWIVATIAAAERFTYWSTQVTWQNFIQHGLDDETRGMLGLGEAAGTSINNAFNVVVYMLPIIIGPIAGGHLGRYRTLQICNFFYLIGMVFLLGCSFPVAKRAGAALPGFAVALCLMAIGLGGVQTITSALIEDQYDEMVPKISYRKNTERVVIDRGGTIHYVYSIYFWLANVASLVMIPSSLLEKYVSFWSAYIMATIVLCLSFLVLWLGKPHFVLRPASNTVMPHTFRVLSIAVRARFRLNAALPEAQLEQRGNQLPWDSDFVRDIRSGLMAVKVCLAWPFLRLSIGILSTNSISQAGQTQTVGVPNNLLMALNFVALVIIGIILEKRRIAFRDMARIEFGLLFMTLIYNAPPCYSYPMECTGPDGQHITGPNDINEFVQLPVYVIVAVGEVFAMVTGQAYAYKQAPLNMNSLLQSIYAVFNGIGYLFAMAIGPTAKNPDLVVTWSCVTGVMGTAAIAFWFCFRHYDQEPASA